MMNFLQRILRKRIEAYLDEIEELADKYVDSLTDVSVASLVKENGYSKEDLVRYSKLQNRIVILSFMLKEEK